MRSYASGDNRRIVKIIADTLIKGVSVPASEEATEVDAADAATLIAYSKAEPWPQEDLGPEQLAKAAAQAKAQLLAQIAVAETVDELEELLSEDDDIIYAYEQRLLEIGK